MKSLFDELQEPGHAIITAWLPDGQDASHARSYDAGEFGTGRVVEIEMSRGGRVAVKVECFKKIEEPESLKEAQK